jgi:hypothetical protein
MIEKFQIAQLRNAEHLQFTTDSGIIFDKYNLEPNVLSPFYRNHFSLRSQEEKAMALEIKNKKIKEKNEVELYRDRLHSKLFNYVKSILYDEKDPLFELAQEVMSVVKSVGNPTHLSENAETALITTLGNKLEPYNHNLEAIGAKRHLEKLLEANRQFAQLETECREIVSERVQANLPSVATIRKEIDVVYRQVVNAINVFIQLNGEERYGAFVADLNTLVNKYSSLIAQRKTRKETKD